MQTNHTSCIDVQGGVPPAMVQSTRPSWRPRRGIDHILTSPSLAIDEARVIDTVLSDHLPVHMRIALPGPLAGTLAASHALA